MEYSEMLLIPPYSLSKEEKNRLLTARLKELTVRHEQNCSEYANILKDLNWKDVVIIWPRLLFLSSYYNTARKNLVLYHTSLQKTDSKPEDLTALHNHPVRPQKAFAIYSETICKNYANPV